MIASTQTTILKFSLIIDVLVFKLLHRRVLLIKRKDKIDCYKVGYFLRKKHISWVNYCKIINSWNAKFSGYS